MRFENYFSMQRELDQYIMDEKKLNDKDTKDMINAMFCGLFSELKEVADCYNEEVMDKEHCLEEHIDVFHFLLSIGWRSGLDSAIGNLTPQQVPQCKLSIFTASVELMDGIRAYKVWSNKLGLEPESLIIYWLRVFAKLKESIEKLGYTWSDAEKMYAEKWQVNKNRQKEGY